MIRKYKSVSIIYGGSGAEYARKVNKQIKELEERERYPFISYIVMENILTGDILSSVINIFKQSDICIAILTADDVFEANRKRLRQNVVFELGMALFHLGKEKCIILSDFDISDSDFELPSDLTGLEVTYFEKDKFEGITKDLLEKLITFSVDSNMVTLKYDNLFYRNEYFVDYRSLFGQKGKELSYSNRGIEKILKSWVEETQSLLHYDEKAVHYFERIGFLPIFENKYEIEWYNNTIKLLSSYNADDIYKSGNKKILDEIRELIRLSTEYSLSKVVDTTNKNTYIDLIERFGLLGLIDSTELNPLIKTVYYDYYGLSYLKLYGYTEDINHLNCAAELFDKALEYVDKVDMDLCIWEGFLRYNYLRTLIRKYRKDDSVISLSDIKAEFLKTINIRRHWIDNVEFGVVIRNALSYEYFIVKKSYVSFLGEFNLVNKDELLIEYEKLKGEINAYISNDESTSKLSQLRNRIINEALIFDN